LWLTKGDRNTKFFHAAASERKKRNVIKKVEKRRWRRGGGDGLKGFIANEYKKLFLSHAALRLEEVLSCVHSRVTPEMNTNLTQLYTEDEVWVTVQAIGDLKALGWMGCPFTRSSGHY
jgi:hypothetical protein